MSVPFLYALVGIGLFCHGLHALIVHDHLLRKILAINVMGSGVFLVLVALARRGGDSPPDPVPHAMVITGIVVALSATALSGFRQVAHGSHAHVRAERQSPGEHPGCGDPFPAGAGGLTIGSQSSDGGLMCCVSVFNRQFFSSILKDFLNRVFFMVLRFSRNIRH